MPMDDVIVMKKSEQELCTPENFIRLLEYFKNTSENLCSCCKNEIKCEGEKCRCYENLGRHGKSEDGTDFYWDSDITCLDLNFGDCQMYEGTICYDCIHSESGTEGFEWNGKLK